MKKMAPFLVQAVVAAILCFLVKDSLKPDPKVERGSAATAVAAPSFIVTARDGTTVDLTPRAGRFRLVHFWATWCPPCEEELPALLEYAKTIAKDPDVELLTISVDEDWKTVDEWLEKRGARDLPVLLDKGKRAAASFGTTKFPETYVVSSKGEILTRVQGPMEWKSPDVRRRLDEMKGR